MHDKREVRFFREIIRQDGRDILGDCPTVGEVRMKLGHVDMDLLHQVIAENGWAWLPEYANGKSLREAVMDVINWNDHT